MTRLDWFVFAACLALVTIGVVASGVGVNGLLLVPLFAAFGVALYAMLSTT